MALNDKLKEANKLLEDLEKAYKRIDEKNPFEGMSAANVNIDELKENLKEVNEYLGLMDDKSNELVVSFKSIVEEVGKGNKAYNNSTKSLTSLTSVAGKLRDHQQGINKLSSDQIKNLQSKAKSEGENLKANRKILESKAENTKLSDKEVALLANINGLLGENDSALNSLVKSTGEEAKERKKVEKSLGIAGGLLKGIAKIPIVGDLVDSKQAVEAMEGSLEKTGSRVKALGAGFKNLGGQIRSGVLNPANIVLGIITELIRAFSTSQKSIGELAKGLGMSASEATEMRQEFGTISNQSNDINVTVKGLQESQLAIGKALGTNVMLNKEDLKTMSELVKKTGLQHEDLIGIEKLSLATNKNLDKQVEGALGGATAYASQNKLIVDNNKVLREVNKASSSLKLSLGGSVEALGEAVVKSQQFGINLEQANSIAQSLLNFEDSISKELEAELLTGKNLNFEKARQLSLEGDIAGAAAEVLEQIEGSKEFTEMNVIQQQAMADAVGMTRDQLADSLIEREALANMAHEEGQTALQAYNTLKASGKTQKEITAQLGEEAALKLEQQSSQEKFNAAIEKAREIFVRIMDTVAPIFDVLASIAGVVLPALNFAFEPIRFAVSSIVEGFQHMKDLISENADVAAVFATVLGGILITQQIIAFKKKEGFLYSVREYAMSKKQLIIEGLKQAKKTIMAAIEKRGLIMAIAQAAMGAFKAMTAIPVVGPALGAAAAASAVAYGYSLIKGDDVMSPGEGSPGYGKRTLMGPEGAIQLNNKDTVLAGTNLFDGKSENDAQSSSPQQPTQQTTSNVDMTQTNALLKQLINVITTGGAVTLDGQKVGEALKLGSYSTQ